MYSGWKQQVAWAGVGWDASPPPYAVDPDVAKDKSTFLIKHLSWERLALCYATVCPAATRS